MTTQPHAPFVLPGLANAHSHAFQRWLRGHVQHRDPEREDSFWSWRERMYALAAGLDLQGLEAASRATYVECLEAGYTAVGEFHYLHHGAGGGPWRKAPDDSLAASRAVLRAAGQAGIRLALLWTVYARGGFGRPLSERQARFGTSDPDHVRRALDGLTELVDGERTTLGLALHSVRAVPEAWLGPLAEEARTRGLPLHVHVSEQPAEVHDCLRATGLTPVGLLSREGVLGRGTTLVHATWLDEDDLGLVSRSGARICLCPTTEGDLGDGVPRTAELHERGVHLCIGSDSHATIDPFAELRALEHQARNATGRRCVLTDDAGHVAPALLDIASTAGYRALALPSTGDRVYLDQDARLLEGSGEHWLAAALTAGHPGLVRRVEVGGEVVVEGGRHMER